MKISGLYENNETVFSCEIFPPKPGVVISTLYETINQIRQLNPHFISVTYGAGGGTRKRTLTISDDIKNRYCLEPLMHLTCIDSLDNEIQILLEQIKGKNIENILALRGDIPQGRESGDTAGDFSYASDLVKFIKQVSKDCCIGVAGYPEGHPESESIEKDIYYLKKKVDCGAEFIITQLFFDNDYFYRFMERVREAGIDVPVSAGVMPVFKASLVKKMVSLSGAAVPDNLKSIIEKYSDSPDDMEKAGIDFARNQIEDILACGSANGIHLYTMNRASLARRILGGLDEKGR